ncbi:hypothetical protein BJX96DRAFT_154282 [Aspergillus floccosus]
MLSVRQTTSLLIAAILLCSIVWVFHSASSSLPNTLPAMSVTHIVLFQFKADATPEVVKDVCSRMLALKDECIHPTSQKPYIKFSSGGADNSPEGIQNGITHAFVVEFASAADRDYYVKEDPTHQEFVRSLGGVIEKAQVIDFTPGVF